VSEGRDRIGILSREKRAMAQRSLCRGEEKGPAGSMQNEGDGRRKVDCSPLGWGWVVICGVGGVLVGH